MILQKRGHISTDNVSITCLYVVCVCVHVYVKDNCVISYMMQLIKHVD